MTEGWILLHRQLFDHKLWKEKPFSRAQAWIDLLLLANHREGVVTKRGVKITVKRGQVGWSQRALAKRWGWSRGKVERFTEWLKTEQQIDPQNGPQNLNLTSLITIVNYDKYQVDGPQNEPQNGPQIVKKQGHEQRSKKKESIPGEVKAENPPYEAIVEEYLKLCPSLPQLRGVSDARKRQMKARWLEHRKDFAIFTELFSKAEASDWLTGRNGGWGGAGFDWLLNRENMQKVLEGNYQNKGGKQCNQQMLGL